MGFFHKQDAHKNMSAEDAADIEEHFFDENFREELRNHGRWYFEKVINKNADLFKKDLDATISQINTELKDHVAQQLDAAITDINTELKERVTNQLDHQLAEYSKVLKDAQDSALQSITRSAQTLQEQHQQLAADLQKSIADQKTQLNGVFESNKAQIQTMNDSQASALQWLAQSTHAMQEQHDQLKKMLEEDVKAQESTLVEGFESNMAQVIEHYLLGALGDQYDLKAQLPAIIQQMEANKQAIVDDMKL